MSYELSYLHPDPDKLDLRAARPLARVIARQLYDRIVGESSVLGIVRSGDELAMPELLFDQNGDPSYYAVRIFKDGHEHIIDSYDFRLEPGVLDFARALFGPGVRRLLERHPLLEEHFGPASAFGEHSADHEAPTASAGIAQGYAARPIAQPYLFPNSSIPRPVEFHPFEEVLASSTGFENVIGEDSLTGIIEDEDRLVIARLEFEGADPAHYTVEVFRDDVEERIVLADPWCEPDTLASVRELFGPGLERLLVDHPHLHQAYSGFYTYDPEPLTLLGTANAR